MKSRAWLVLLAFAAIAVSSAFAKDELVGFSARKDTTFAGILTYNPDSPPVFVAILLPGGKGDFHFKSKDGGITMINEERLPNRLRSLFLERGVASYLVDSPSDMGELTDHFRASREHVADLEAVLDDAAKRFPNVPVIVIGHSNGTQSAAYVAAAEQKKIQGVVLIEGRFAWIKYNDKFFDSNGLSNFDWSSIKIPVLIIQHKKDDCFAMPYEAAAKVAEHNRAFQFITIDPPGSVATGECTYKGTHNLVGQEAVVADDMLNWFKTMVKGEAAH